MDRYEEALERAKKGLPIDEVFPELKESEDERIRKFLVELVSNDKANNYNGLYKDRGVRFDDVLAYLEKQKEQKPTLDDYLKATPAERRKMSMTEILEKEQQPAEWSEEDEKMLEHIISDLREFRDCETDEELVSDYEDEITWLKSLRSRPKSSDNWKPSEEQMEALKYALGEGGTFDKNALKSLFDDLKKI